MSEPEDWESRIRVLEDRERIRELRATYCFLVDDGRFDELVDLCFTEDATCDFRAVDGSIPSVVAQGREEVRQFYVRTVGGALRNMCHTIHNHRIAVTGDQAAGDCYFELTATDVASGEDLMGAGRYVDRYRRLNGAWRFEKRRAEIFYIAPLCRGWEKQRFPASLGWKPR